MGEVSVCATVEDRVCLPRPCGDCAHARVCVCVQGGILEVLCPANVRFIGFKTVVVSFDALTASWWTRRSCVCIATKPSLGWGRYKVIGEVEDASRQCRESIKALAQGFYRCLQVVTQREYVYCSSYVFITCINREGAQGNCFDMSHFRFQLTG